MVEGKLQLAFQDPADRVPVGMFGVAAGRAVNVTWRTCGEALPLLAITLTPAAWCTPAIGCAMQVTRSPALSKPPIAKLRLCAVRSAHCTE